MLYPTLAQPYVFLVLFAVGIAGGMVFDIAAFCTLACKNNRIAKQLFLFCATMTAFCIVFFTNLHINYGQFRAYVPLAFLLGLTLERYTLGKLWTKTMTTCYNTLTGLMQRLQQRLRKHDTKKE